METTINSTTIDILESEDPLKGKFLLFGIKEEIYGIDIRYVTEIGVMQKITAIPDFPDSIIGVINLRGKIIPVIDMRKRFSFEKKAYDDRTCIIVVDLDEMKVGLIVDTVMEVTTIPDELIDPPPSIHSGVKNQYIEGLGKIDKKVIILLGAKKLLYEDEIKSLKEI